MLKKFNEFKLLLEKEIKISTDLENRLKNMKSPFGDKLLSYLKSDKIPDDAKIDELDLTDDKTLNVITQTSKRPFKIGNLFRLLDFKDFTQLDIQHFVDHLKTVKNDGLKEINGKDILWAYHEDNYEKNDTDDKGDLNKSCMRYDKCQEWLEIYTNNPEVCSLLVLYNPEGLVRGRCLIWTDTDGQRFADRVYCSNDQYIPDFNTYFRENSIETSPTGVVQLKKSPNDRYEYTYYPFMDTLKYYYTDTGILSDDIYDDDYSYIELVSTTGDYEDSTYVWSNYEKEYIDIESEDVIYLDYIDDYVYYKHTVWEEYMQEEYLKDDCILDYASNYIYSKSAISLYTGEFASEYDDNIDVLSKVYYNSKSLEIDKDSTIETYDGQIILKDDAIVIQTTSSGHTEHTHKNEVSTLAKLDPDNYDHEYALKTDTVKLYNTYYAFKTADLVKLFEPIYGKDIYAFRSDDDIIKLTKGEDEHSLVIYIEEDEKDNELVINWLNS
jgi:hypothetical protein